MYSFEDVSRRSIEPNEAKYLLPGVVFNSRYSICRSAGERIRDAMGAVQSEYRDSAMQHNYPDRMFFALHQQLLKRFAALFPSHEWTSLCGIRYVRASSQQNLQVYSIFATV